MAKKAKRAASKRKATRRRASPPRPRAGRDELEHPVRVRMYRLGLGECFLLSFARLGVPFHMLIDCGVMHGRQGRHPPIRQVVEDIWRTTAGRLDVLVVTHRHWDRISGFVDAGDIFERMAVDQVWLSWTEDPRDVEARRLAHVRGFGSERHDQAMDLVRRMGGSETRYWRGGDGPVAVS
jgi:glyoxylase-like metal-dependent hydrolase (beta-lactamase superfamily II)